MNGTAVMAQPADDPRRMQAKPEKRTNTPLQGAAVAVREVRDRAENLNARLAGIIPPEEQPQSGKQKTPETFIDTLERAVEVIFEESRATLRFLDHINERFETHSA